MERKLLALIVLAVLISSLAAEAQTTVRVPDVVGKSLRQAKSLIRQADLRPDVKKKESSEPLGTVIVQHPRAGRRVNAGRTVLLVVSANCTPGYSPCIPPGPDVDCAGGSGDGPRYVEGPVRVTGSDPYGLDSDNDGIGCET
jgi:hypothetical protein